MKRHMRIVFLNRSQRTYLLQTLECILLDTSYIPKSYVTSMHKTSWCAGTTGHKFKSTAEGAKSRNHTYWTLKCAHAPHWNDDTFTSSYLCFGCVVQNLSTKLLASVTNIMPGAPRTKFMNLDDWNTLDSYSQEKTLFIITRIELQNKFLWKKGSCSGG